jgi:hypothetical protein
MLTPTPERRVADEIYRKLTSNFRDLKNESRVHRPAFLLSVKGSTNVVAGFRALCRYLIPRLSPKEFEKL